MLLMIFFYLSLACKVLQGVVPWTSIYLYLRKKIMSVYDGTCNFGDFLFHLFYSFVQGLYRGSENNEMRLGVCSRSNEVVEPMIKPQWYVNCNDLAKQALFVVVDEENKRIEIIPKQYLVDQKRYLYLCLLFENSCNEHGKIYLVEHSFVVVYKYLNYGPVLDMWPQKS